MHVSIEHLENLFYREFQKFHERLDCIERKYRRNYEKRDREKEREDTRMKREEQMKKHIANFEVSWDNLFLNKGKGREKGKQESKEKFESEVKGEEIIEKEIESVFVATENVTIPKSEKEKEEIVEK
ncbi:hypothetical protein QL285_080131 [Trifolium repens]|nr:hypothetical protein QL285_080131 [Trifolium repens]